MQLQLLFLRLPLMIKTLQHFFWDPIRARHFGLFLFRLSQLLHERTNGKFDAWYVRLAKVFRPSVELPPSQWLAKEEAAKAVVALKADGCYVLPKSLSVAELEEIRAFAFSTPAYGAHLDERIFIREDRIPTDRGRYYWPMHALVQVPAVRRLIEDSALHQIAQQYLGARPVLSHVTLWMDPAYQGDFDPHVYHYDNDGPAFLKFFFYITDVEEDTGAHRYIRNTHAHQKPAPYRISRRYDENDLLNYFGADKEVVFAAPAGTIIAEDTAGFHRGTTVKRNHRLLMQFQYSLLDIPHEEDVSGITRRTQLPDMNVSIVRIASKFFA